MTSISAFSADPKNISCLSEDERTKMKDELERVVDKYKIKELENRFVDSRAKLLEASDAVDSCESKPSLIRDVGGENYCGSEIDEYNRLLNLSNLLSNQIETFRPLAIREILNIRASYTICE